MKKLPQLICQLVLCAFFIVMPILSGCSLASDHITVGETLSTSLTSTPYQDEKTTLSSDDDETIVAKQATPTPTQFDPQMWTVTPAESLTLTSSLQETIEKSLYEASLNYIATSPDEADAVVRKIGYIDGKNESASNACGPLSIAIMKDAGLLPDSTSLHEIWLLDLRNEYILSNVLHRMYFPPQTYDYIKIDQSVGDYDFQNNPLQPGDWLFLFTSGNGYDHILVVTRVDDSGAAYTVTNIDRGDGFIISEELLYDPHNEGEGLFYELSDPEGRRLLGLTGTAGFLVVRRRDGLASIPRLNLEVDVESADKVKWHALVKDLNSDEVLFESLPNEKFHPASLIKIPIAIVALNLLEEQGYKISDFDSKGYSGRTFDQLFTAMVVSSEELASENLSDFIRQNGGEIKKFEELGINDTRIEPRTTTAYDLSIFLEGLYAGEFLDQDYTDYLLQLMHVQTENDKEYLGIITSELNEGVLYNKRGLLLSPTIVSDMGVFEVDGQVFLIIISGIPKADGVITYEEIKSSLEDFALRLGKILLNE